MRHLLLLICALALSGCAQRQMGTYFQVPSASAPAVSSSADPKIIFMTIDGTSSTLTNRTNPGRLHEIVESYSYQYPDRRIATYYAEGVGSGDAKLLALVIGKGVNSDIKSSYAFLTRVWQVGDPIYLNGFSRGAYTARALAGLIYMAGIPDLSALPAKRRNRVVSALFNAYKTRLKKGETPFTHAQRRADLIAEVTAEFGLTIPVQRKGGFRNNNSAAVIHAMTLWDTVAALGTPNGRDDPLETPSRYLLTNCNVEHLFHALSLDDNRASSFTPVMAGGAKTLELCANENGTNNRSQRVNSQVKEVWFSGAHADVGGTYMYDGMLDGNLPSIGLNWMLSELEGVSPELFPKGLRVPEDRLNFVHDGEIIRKASYHRSRKPIIYSKRVHGGIAPIALHASVLDRMEFLFALDARFARCSGTDLKLGADLLCAQELASYGLIPELFKQGCIEPSDWGYRLMNGQEARCVQIVGTRKIQKIDGLALCDMPRRATSFTGYVFKGTLEDAELAALEAEQVQIPFPHCVGAQLAPAPF